MSAEGITIEQLYSLFAPSERPESFGSFEIFGCAECQPPIGQEKPEGAGDLPPFRQHTYRREDRPRRFVRGGAKVKKEVVPERREKKLVTTVEVNPRFANIDFASSWAKGSTKAGTTTTTTTTAEPAKPQAAKPETGGWGQKPKTQVRPFADLVAEETDDITTNPALAWGDAGVAAASTTAAAPDDKEWPSLGVSHDAPKKKSGWGGFKP